MIRKVPNIIDPDKAGLSPLEPLDLDKINDFDDLLTAMEKTSFGGRRLGEALNVLEKMITDQQCHVVLTLSGAMTVAKMGMIICKMIDNGWVNTIISTGALIGHGFIENLGLKHYKYEKNKGLTDKDLCKMGLNRVYDTLEPESNFIHAEDIADQIFDTIRKGSVLCSYELCKCIGKFLHEKYEGKGILKSAYEKGCAVYIPAFTDCEMALNLAIYMMMNSQGKEADNPWDFCFSFNPFLDLLHYTKRLMGAKRLGIFTVGGGVPRNWAQQLGPFVEMALQKVEGLNWKMRRFQYGVRICPEPEHWGGLSGCSYEEGVSWGKFVPLVEGGEYAEILCDATVVLPILVKALEQRLRKKSSHV